MTPLQATDVFLRQVRRCRRRLQWVFFVRHGLVALALASVVPVVSIVIWRADVQAAIASFAAAAALLVAATAAAAWWIGPDLRSTAARLDERLNLEDRVVTALQCLRDDDPVAGLIRRDAAMRVAELAPARVFPLEARYGRQVLAVPAAAILFVLALTMSPRTNESSNELRAGGDSRASGALRPLRNASNRQQAGATEEVSAAGATTAGAAAERARPLDAPSGAREQSAGQDSFGDPASNTGSTTGRSVDASRDAATSLMAASGPAAAARSGRGNSGGGGAGDSKSNEGGAGSGTAPTAEGIARGTVGSTALAPDDFIESAESHEHDGSYQARYRAAWVRAQAAFARNDVPAPLRRYLRAYFTAIRPPESK